MLSTSRRVGCRPAAEDRHDAARQNVSPSGDSRRKEEIDGAAATAGPTGTPRLWLGTEERGSCMPAGG
eukprot:scaffold114138_cov38-Prasinocladus_malaysianus.AAC.1